MKKWNEASVIEDQIRERSGRPKNTRTNENIALLRAAHHTCADKGEPLKAKSGCTLQVEILSVDWYLFHCLIICDLDFIMILRSIIFLSTLYNLRLSPEHGI